MGRGSFFSPFSDLTNALGGVDVSIVTAAVVGIAIYWIWDLVESN